ncbi:MAG: sugar phosphate isomerase/epimerase family protein [Acidobacteriota bacterium]
MNHRQVSRRDLVGAGVVASGALAAAPRGKTGSKDGLKVGLYSITYLGVWYRGEPLTLEQVLDRAKEYGYQGVEIDGKRPHGNPLDMPRSRCLQLHKKAEQKGLEIYAVSANNDFSSPIAEHRQCQLLYLRELIRMTADLGAKALRVFLAWPGVTKHPQIGRYDIARRIWQETHKDFSEEEIWDWCRQGLIESARCAGDHGVTLALQNHGPVIKDHQDVLRMVREVGSPHLKVCLDAPIMPKKDPVSVRQAALDTGSLQVLSHFGGDYEGRNTDGSVKGQDFYLPFVRAMIEIGYRGYLGYELCHPLPVVNGQTVGIDYADTSARLAAEFMRGVIAQAVKETPPGRPAG